MSRTAIALAGLALLAAGCQTPLERGERLYREGDRLAALETWRGVDEGDSQYPEVRARITVVEEEFQQLVERYKQRGRYFEERGHLAESILDYRLALKLQPDDEETLAKVQELARTLAERKEELATRYGEAIGKGDLAAARRAFDALRSLDAFDPELETDERYLRAALHEEVARRLEAARHALSAASYAPARRELAAVLALEPNNESARGYLAYIDTVDREAGAPAPFDAPDPLASDAQIRAEGFYRNALAAEQSGDLYAAIRHDQRALRADPQHGRARAHLGHLREQLADRVDPLVEAGREAFQRDDLQSALDYWRLALLIEPGNERTRAYLARAERQLANLESLRSDPDVASQE